MDVVSPAEDLKARAGACRACALCEGRTQVVVADGSWTAKLMLVGEAPGKEEDRLGLPFVGAAGQLLDRILEAAGFLREEVFITNTVMCRPPGNRQPSPEEMAQCRPFFLEKMALVQPQMVVILGAVALRGVLGLSGITKMRGQRIERDGVAYYPTFHPAALLRDPSKKRPVWEDFKRIRDDYRALSSQRR